MTKGLDVLAVDLDPQANLSQGLMRNNYGQFLKERRPSIVELFNGYIPPRGDSQAPQGLEESYSFELIGRKNNKALHLIPSRFDFSDALLNSLRPNPRVLARYLSSNFTNKDLILIDCSPTESVLTTAAYHASSKVLVPVKPEFFATIGFPLLRESLDLFRKQNPANSLQVTGVVINNSFYDGGNNGGPEKEKALREIKHEAKKNGWPLYKNELPHSRGFPKMMRGDYTYLGNATSFYSFADEFFKSIGL